MRIHAIETGRVRIKASQIVGKVNWTPFVGPRGVGFKV
jgi:hypothetical protein